MRGRRFMATLATVLVFAGVACRKAPPPAESSPEPNAEPLDPNPAAPRIAAERLPRCHADGARVGLLGEDVIVGESTVSAEGITVGLVRREGGTFVASVLLTPFDLANPRYVDLGPARGDDPPPVPFATSRGIFVAHHGRRPGESALRRDVAGHAPQDGAGRRELRVVRLDAGKPVEIGPAIVQQADESQAFDLAVGEGSAPPLIAWDEDAPPEHGRMLADRGVIKVQEVGGAAAVVSPSTSDAESPRVIARPGGFVLAWLAKKSADGDAGAPADAAKVAGVVASEGPGEVRTYRWIEWVALDAKGVPTAPVRRLTSEHGHVAAFDLRGIDGGRVVAVVQDEAAVSEGGGARIQRVVVEAEHAPGDLLVDAGVGTTLANIVPQVDPGRPWLAFADTSERSHLLPLSPAFAAGAGATLEPALDGARVLGASGDRVVAVSSVRSTSISDGDAREGRPELLRLVCR